MSVTALQCQSAVYVYVCSYRMSLFGMFLASAILLISSSHLVSSRGHPKYDLTGDLIIYPEDLPADPITPEKLEELKLKLEVMVWLLVHFSLRGIGINTCISQAENSKIIKTN